VRVKEDGNYVTHVNRDEKGYKKVDDGRQEIIETYRYQKYKARIL